MNLLYTLILTFMHNGSPLDVRYLGSYPTMYDCQKQALVVSKELANQNPLGNGAPILECKPATQQEPPKKDRSGSREVPMMLITK